MFLLRGDSKTERMPRWGMLVLFAVLNVLSGFANAENFRFYFLLPEDRDWQAATPMLSADGGVTGTAMHMPHAGNYLVKVGGNIRKVQVK